MGLNVALRSLSVVSGLFRPYWLRLRVEISSQGSAVDEVVDTIRSAVATGRSR